MRKISEGKKRNALCILLIAVTISLLSPYIFVFPAAAAGTTYYVSTSGSNSNSGTITQPWRTIQKAADTVTAGDTVYIRGGTYHEKVALEDVQGTSSAWITFAPYNSETVVVDAYGLSGTYDGIFDIEDGCSYIRITGMELKRTTGHGVFLHGGEINHIRIDHCTIHDCESSGIYCYSEDQPTKYVRNVEFDYNTVYDVNNGLSYSTSSVSPQEAISFSNVQGFNIHHNTLSAYGKEGIDVKSGSNTGSIHHNTISTSLASPAFQWSYNHIGIYVDGYVRKNYDISVYCNRITGYGGLGIALGAESTGGSIEDISIYNNVIALSHLSGHTNFRGIDSFYDCPWKDISIYSNTIYNGGSSNSPIRIFPSASHITNCVIANNIISGTSYDLLCFQELRSYEISGRLTLTKNLYYRFGDTGHNLWKDGADKSWGSSAVTSDPKFVSRTDLNLHLQSSSPAINVGSSTYAPSSDFDGIVRPQGTADDIGAYEYGSSPANNPVVFSGMSPANGSTNVPISTSSLSVTITDPEGNSFDYTIQTRPNVGSRSSTGSSSGTKVCSLSGLTYGTTYRWWVNATDGSSWTRRWYTFTTVSNPGNNPPVFTAMSPANGSTNVPISTSSLSVTITDPEGNSFDYTIQTRPNVGSRSSTGSSSGTKVCPLSGLTYGTTYRWWVNATDGSSWTRRWYTFTTVSNPTNRPLTFNTISPANGSKNIPITTSTLSLTIQDPEGKSFSFTIQTIPNVGSRIGSGVYNGTKSCYPTNLAYGTTYKWWVNASDGSSWTRRWYTFTTAPNPTNSPVQFTLVSPANRSTNIPISTTSLTITIKDPEGKTFDYTIQTSPKVGSRSSSGTTDGAKVCSLSGLAYGTTYHWWINATDGTSWTRRMYIFTTENDDSRVTPPSGGGGGGESPPPADENETPLPPQVNTPPSTPSAPLGRMAIECGTSYNYTTNAYDPDGNRIRLQIDWGDGNLSDWSAYIDSNTTISFSHTWMTPMNYTLFTLAQDETGLYSPWSEPLLITAIEPLINGETPIIDINIINNGSVNETIIFDASNSTASDGRLVSYHWSYGDGSTGSGATSQHTYTEPGVYVVNLTVIDDSAQIFTKTFQITIDVLTNVPVTTIVTSFSFTSTALLIAECVIVIGMMLVLRHRNMHKERSKKQRELSVEEKVDRLLSNKRNK